jgi:hypothetical protein
MPKEFLRVIRSVVMSTISLRLPAYLHERVRELADREGISINQFISLALAEKLSALMTEEYLGQRARSGDWESFEKALAKVADIEPEAKGRLYREII